MCGRYSLLMDEVSLELQKLIRQAEVPGGKSIKTGEIFPTNLAPVLKAKDGELVGEGCVWGFPNFSRKGVIINARSETAVQKPMFRKSLLERRCVVPTTGFFEWSQDDAHQKYLFHPPQSEVLYLAGIYNAFDGEDRYVILTTQANASMKEIHHRMPVILDSETLSGWLEDTDFALNALSRPMPQLERHAV